MIQHIRQENIFNPINQRFKIVIFGAGSLGSFMALNLAKLGFKNIEVVDYDRVEDYNLPNQFYRSQDVGIHKVIALQEIIKSFAEVEIGILLERLSRENISSYYSSPAINDLFILTFDNLESRKLVYDHLKGFGNYLIDARMGGEEFQIMTSLMNDDNDLKIHDQEFNITPTEIPCGEKSVIYSVLAISAEVCNIVKKINENQPFPKKLNRHMKRNIILSDVK